ncbi:response regulator [Coraliomargarita sp. SDUM461004]|uniref:Response regulator n=1 Tax=Thalassobacterium sedimentorum TaxID=3041258 RepID=A0ABU1AL62_9BACT|nr:response regulator [Coraliomargarita sp. SDUM461004]MDQ8195541.1 response regulator [Coraliomargarita sp. SDUM461004]
MPPMIKFVIAEDDEDDQFLIKEALESCGVRNPYVFVNDGVELLDYLNQELNQKTADMEAPALIILLDLNMPRMDGREALRKLKADPVLRRIPVVILTTSKSDEDIVRSYESGVNSFVTKPVSFEGLVSVIAELKRYWIEVVEIPKPGKS